MLSDFIKSVVLELLICSHLGWLLAYCMSVIPGYPLNHYAEEPLLLWGPCWLPGLPCSYFPQGALEVNFLNLAYQIHDWWFGWYRILSWKSFSFTNPKTALHHLFLSLQCSHPEDHVILVLKPLYQKSVLWWWWWFCVFVFNSVWQRSLMKFHGVLWCNFFHSQCARPFQFETSDP
jgi:hypothetical protein